MLLYNRWLIPTAILAAFSFSTLASAQSKRSSSVSSSVSTSSDFGLLQNKTVNLELGHTRDRIYTNDEYTKTEGMTELKTILGFGMFNNLIQNRLTLGLVSSRDVEDTFRPGLKTMVPVVKHSIIDVVPYLEFLGPYRQGGKSIDNGLTSNVGTSIAVRSPELGIGFGRVGFSGGIDAKIVFESESDPAKIRTPVAAIAEGPTKEDPDFDMTFSGDATVKPSSVIRGLDLGVGLVYNRHYGATYTKNEKNELDNMEYQPEGRTETHLKVKYQVNPGISVLNDFWINSKDLMGDEVIDGAKHTNLTSISYQFK